MTGTLHILRPYLTPEWRAFAAAGGSTVVVSAAELARPLPLALVVNQVLDREAPFVLTGSDMRLLVLVAALVVGIALADAAGNYVADTKLKLAGERIIHRLRIATHAQLQRLSLGFHERRHAGDLVTRVTGDVNAVGELFSQSLGTIAQALLLLVGMLVVSVFIDPLLALAAFGPAPLLALLTFRARSSLMLAARRQRAKEGEIAALTAETFAAARVVKAFGGEDFEQARLHRHSEERLEAGIETSRIESRFSRAVDLLGSLGVVAVLVVGVLRVAAGAVSPGDLVIMSSYAKRVYRPLRDIARQAGRASRAMARAERVAEILSADEVLAEARDGHRGPRARGELELEGVSFAYEPDRPVLAGLSVRVPAGQRVTVIGHSGAGKSTLAALIARFYDPPSGQGKVLIDGRDVRDCALRWVREQVGLVLQDTVLFTGTVAENIAYGIGAGRDEIVAAARAAAAHQFISDLPEGYETKLGPQGVGLSGGQRQRIAIARALLRDPAILVLDEPTAGLDATSEARVLEGLEALMSGRTTLIITHSPTLATRADRVIEFEGGRIVADGPPNEVLPVRRPGAGAGRGRRARAGSPPPADPALPLMPRLLDPDTMAGALGRSLRGDQRAPEVSVRYLRYKPATNLVVHYEAAIEGRRHGAVAMIAARPYLGRRAAKPENLALARLVDGRSPAAMPLAFDPELEALIQWLPLDISMPGLAEPAERLHHRLQRSGIEPAGLRGEPSLLAYKPRRRAVLRLGEHVLKIYAKDHELVPAANGLRLSSAMSALPTPRFEACVPELCLTAQSLVAGQRPHDAAAVADGAGRVLALLHRAEAAGLPDFPPAAQLAAASASGELVATIAPGLGARVRRLLARLESRALRPGPLVPSHGDFNARQLLEAGGELTLVDFDALCAAPPALDPATYAAYLVNGGPADLGEARAALTSLLDGYGARPSELDWYLATAIMRRSPRPFRYLEQDWPERVEGMLRAAEEGLGK